MTAQFYWTHIKRYKRGASHRDGTPLMCVRCSIIPEVRRKSRAVITGRLRNDKRPEYGLLVGYCEEHIPNELQEQLEGGD